MNIILSGPDACGKTTLAEKLRDKYDMRIVHSTATTRNDLTYHLDWINYNDNIIFDRWSVGELIFPKIYNRPAKLTEEEFFITLKQVIDNNDMYIIFICSDVSILEKRLISRGEFNYLDEIRQQCELYNEVALKMKEFFKGYKNFYIIDIAQENAYDKLDTWIDSHFGKVTLNVAYRKLSNDLLDYGHEISSDNKRGTTKEICNYLLKITDIDTNECVTLKSGGTNLTYAAAELLWYWSARNDIDFISKFSKFWDNISDDGITANSAYGYILQEKHGFNQIDKIIELLAKKPDSRRAVLNINVPNENVIETRDEMCTICLNYQVRDNKLHCTCVMRSQDFKFGALYDFPFFIYLQKYIAKRLNLDCGTYTHFVFSMHVYNKDIPFAKKIAYSTLETVVERLDIEKLLEHREELVDWIDNSFTSREDFYNKLRKENIIYVANSGTKL